MTTRRQFIQTSMAAGLAAGLGAAALARPQESSKQPDSAGGKKLKILILGGTGFLGPAIINAALAKGHSITTFTRGKTRPGLFTNVEKLHGDRDPKKDAIVKDAEGKETKYEGLKSLEGRKWDVVIDDSGFYPRMVKASAELLSPNVGQYIYISSVSAYADNKIGGNEDDKLAELADPTVENMGQGYQNYGGLKALCERAAEAACPGKTTVVRPGFIIGPDDNSGRFPYWPVRVDRGGEVLAPGKPSDSIQVIDVRDLGEWLVLLAERKTFGIYDALGPKAGELTMGKLLEGCSKSTKTPHTFTWVPADFLLENNLSPGGHFPIWIPGEGESAGFHQRDISKSLKAGIKFRPIEETCKDTLEWWKSLPDDSARKKFPMAITADKEKEVLAAWHDKQRAAKPQEKKPEGKS